MHAVFCNIPCGMLKEDVKNIISIIENISQKSKRQRERERERERNRWWLRWDECVEIIIKCNWIGGRKPGV